MIYHSGDGKNGNMVSMNVSELMIRMRDDVAIYTLVIQSEAKGKSPVILVRNPYVTNEVDIQVFCDEHSLSIQAGYTVIFQHCRGCGRSEGDCIPYDFERQDGLDTLEWIRIQPFYNGELFLYGGSYLSSVHFSYLDTVPPDVRGAFLAVQDVNRYNIVYRNGFFKSGLHGEWYVRMYKKNSMPKKSYVAETFRTLPLSRFAQTVFGEEAPAFMETLCHPWPEDPFWRTPAGGSDYLHALDKLRIPVLLVTSFYDLYTEGIFRMWDRIPEENRERCAMVVTPYAHGYNTDTDVPIVFPSGKLSDVWPDAMLNWFNSIRGVEPLRFARLGETVWYSQFDEKWDAAPFLRNGRNSWTFYLNDHTLDQQPGTGKELTYVYNPYSPAEFKGGCCNNFGGMQIQDGPDSRYDILSFLSSPFEEELQIRGTMDVSLQVKTDCPDTCFYARFSLVHDGIAYGMRDDIVSILRQNPGYVPGTQVAVKLHFAENAFRISKGDSIRLDISSSCCPYFVPHTNRAGLFSNQTSAEIAHNTVVSGKSSLTFHVK